MKYFATFALGHFFLLSSSSFFAICVYFNFSATALILVAKCLYRSYAAEAWFHSVVLVLVRMTQAVMRTMRTRKVKRNPATVIMSIGNMSINIYTFSADFSPICIRPCSLRSVSSQSNMRKYLNYFLICVYQHHFLCFHNSTAKRRLGRYCWLVFIEKASKLRINTTHERHTHACWM